MRRFLLLVISVVFAFTTVSGAKVTFKTQSLTVWAQSQIIEGQVDTTISSGALLYINNKVVPITFSLLDSTFSISVKLSSGINKIFIRLKDGTGKPDSDTLTLTLGYRVHPEIYAFASVNGRSVTLNSQVIENPDSSSELNYLWSEDENNPAKGLLALTQGKSANLVIPSLSKSGEYYFNLFVVSGEDTTKFRTLVTVDSSEVKPFNIKTDHASWIDRAIIYEVTPYNFVYQGQFNNITQKLPDLIQLGITTLWIQPIYRTHGGGQGYDVTDFFSVRSDLGSEADLRALIKTAKSLGLRVIFDFVANHTSIYHPYAQHSKKFGKSSHYWTYYQRQKSPGNVPYSQYENSADGLFYNYFWDELPNLNYDNSEVQKWITEAAKYWIEKYDIDGYRFDAIWGVNARNPEFTRQLRLALKRMKPEILMLAEDKAPWPIVFDERFDMAFDWTETQGWVSQWVWQAAYDAPGVDANRTIFNTTNESNRAAAMRASLTNNGKGYPPNAKILRFLENNDTQHFIRHHGIERTKMAAALEFSLNGVPLIYNGQETGINIGHPYSTGGIFFSDQTIPAQDKGMFQYYRRLIQLRKAVPALYSNNFEEAPVSSSGSVFAYRRWTNNQNVFTVANMGASSVTAILSIPVARLSFDTMKVYYLTDLLNGTVQSGRLKDFESLHVSLNQYSAKIFLLADTAMTVVGVEPQNASTIPEKFDISQNYPNPFNPLTVIKYSLPSAGNVTLKVYDILGKEVATLFDGYSQAGTFSTEFNGQGFASGIYIYSIRFNGQSLSKKMILIR